MPENDAEILRLLESSLAEYAIFTIDVAGTIASWNPGVERVLGYTSDEFVGLPFALLFTPADQACSRPAEELTCALENGRSDDKRFHVRKDGSWFPADGVVRLIPGAPQGPTFLKVMYDATHQRRTSDALRHTEERYRLLVESVRDYAVFQAHEASRLKDEFLSTVSHELRTPLNAIVGWTHLLEATTAAMDDTQRRAVRAIARNAQIQVQLVDDLLDVSRIVSGQVRLHPECLLLAEAVRAAVDSVRPAASANHVQIETQVDPDDAVVYADRDRLQQIIWNLLSNAVKFTPAGGHVTVRAATAEDGTSIVVQDTGIGIDAHMLPLVFERFRQADSSTTRRHGGVGLGLAIVRQLVEQHGGTIDAASGGRDAGAMFTVRLPAPPATGPLQTDEPVPLHQARPAGPQLDRVHVLVVDDDEDAREVLRTALTQVGADVVVAHSAATALECVTARLPDVIVADIGMPDEDGYSLMRKVRRAPAAHAQRPPAIALSAFARAEDRFRALEAGFQLHLSKPIVPSVVIDAVARLVHSS